MRINRIAFYGTLRRGYPKHGELGLQRALRYIGRRTIEGALFDLGEYPGLVAGTGGIEVELYGMLDESVLRRLDRYEGYDPARPRDSLFRREPVRVERIAGSGAAACEAWVYLFNGCVEGRARIDKVDGLRNAARRWRLRA